MVFKVLTIQGIWETLHPALCGDVVDQYMKYVQEMCVEIWSWQLTYYSPKIFDCVKRSHFSRLFYPQYNWQCIHATHIHPSINTCYCQYREQKCYAHFDDISGTCLWTLQTDAQTTSDSMHSVVQNNSLHPLRHHSEILTGMGS